MDTKEAIKFLDNDILTISIIDRKVDEFYDKIKGIIKLLQLWEDFKKEYGAYIFSPNLTIEDMMNRLEKKCFSKPRIRKEVRVEVLAENEDVIDELAKEIEEMNGRIFGKGKIRVVSTQWVR